ncbi:MAG: hypothetical protein MJB57_03755, partial [Gemmatimonadetes bacterium]|nr:hypothetical protein [Gemmatimonadota bacterium]
MGVVTGRIHGLTKWLVASALLLGMAGVGFAARSLATPFVAAHSPAAGSDHPSGTANVMFDWCVEATPPDSLNGNTIDVMVQRPDGSNDDVSSSFSYSPTFVFDCAAPDLFSQGRVSGTITVEPGGNNVITAKLRDYSNDQGTFTLTITNSSSPPAEPDVDVTALKSSVIRTEGSTGHREDFVVENTSTGTSGNSVFNLSTPCAPIADNCQRQQSSVSLAEGEKDTIWVQYDAGVSPPSTGSVRLKATLDTDSSIHDTGSTSLTVTTSTVPRLDAVTPAVDTILDAQQTLEAFWCSATTLNQNHIEVLRNGSTIDTLTSAFTWTSNPYFNCSPSETSVGQSKGTITLLPGDNEISFEAF